MPTLLAEDAPAHPTHHPDEAGPTARLRGRSDPRRPATAEPIAVLFERVRSRTPGALPELIRRCEPLVRSAAHRHLGRGVDVDDVVQEVWVALIRHLDRISSADALGGLALGGRHPRRHPAGQERRAAVPPGRRAPRRRRRGPGLDDDAAHAARRHGPPVRPRRPRPAEARGPASSSSCCSPASAPATRPSATRWVGRSAASARRASGCSTACARDPAIQSLR